MMRFFFGYNRLFLFKSLLLVITIAFNNFSCKSDPSTPRLPQSAAYSEWELIRYTDSIALKLTNQPEKASTLFDSVIEISITERFDNALANGLYQNARYKNRSGDFSGAYGDLQKAYQVKEPMDTELATLILIEMAESKQLLLQFSVADSLLQVAEMLANANHLVHHQAAILSAAANIEYSRNNFLKATDLYLKAAAHYKEIEDSVNLAVVHENIGLIYRKSGNYDKAFEYIQKAYVINQLLTDTIKIAINQNNLGVLYRETNQADSALVFYQKSLKLYHKLNLQRGLAMTYMNIANLLTNKSDFVKAENYFDSSLFFIRQMGSEYGLALEQINRANLYIKKSMTEKAIPMLEGALVTCDELHLISEKAEVLKMLYEAWLAIGNHEKALSFYTYHHLISDSLKSVEIQQKLSMLQNDFEIKSREVKLLKLENSLSKAAAKTRTQRHFFVTTLIILILIAIVLFYRKRTIEMQFALVKAKLDSALANLETKNKELHSHSMQLNRLREEYNQRIAEVKDKPESSVSVNVLKSSLSGTQKGDYTLDRRMKDFESRFDIAHEAFFSKLLQLHPNLSPSELRICGFLRNNLSSKEIAVLTNRSVRTIENTRNHIRIKMNLPPKTRLISYLLAID